MLEKKTTLSAETAKHTLKSNINLDKIFSKRCVNCLYVVRGCRLYFWSMCSTISLFPKPNCYSLFMWHLGSENRHISGTVEENHRSHASIHIQSGQRSET